MCFACVKFEIVCGDVCVRTCLLLGLFSFACGGAVTCVYVRVYT